MSGRVLIDSLWIPCPADMFGPRPKGSLAPKGNRYRKGPVQMVESVVDSTRWKTVMTNALQVAVSHEMPAGHPRAVWLESVGQWRKLNDGFPFPGDVAVTALFLMPRRPVDIQEGRLRPTGDSIFGDTDKLCRNLGDAIEAAGVVADDRQISRWVDPRKRFLLDPEVGGRYEAFREGPGVVVTVREDWD
jgi:Holliday junction resolvase RusA-like endonuclease